MFKPILKLLFSCNFVWAIYSTNIQTHYFEIQLYCNAVFLIYNIEFPVVKYVGIVSVQLNVFSEFIGTSLLSLEFSFYVVEIFSCVFTKTSTYHFQGL